MVNWRSKITQTVLSYLLLNPEEELYLNEMARKFGVDRGNLARKLEEWSKEGIVRKEKVGNLSMYQANKFHPLFKEISAIAQKSYGLEKELKDSLSKLAGLKSALIFGSYAKGKMEAESDIDLLLVGEHDHLAAQKIAIRIQKKYGREVNIIDMSGAEYAKKRTGDLLRNIVSGKTIKMI